MLSSWSEGIMQTRKWRESKDYDSQSSSSSFTHIKLACAEVKSPGWHKKGLLGPWHVKNKRILTLSLNKQAFLENLQKKRPYFIILDPSFHAQLAILA